MNMEPITTEKPSLNLEDLPKILKLPEDEASLQTLARMLAIADTIAETQLEKNVGGALMNAYKRILLGTLLVNDNLAVEDFIKDIQDFGGYSEEDAIEAVRAVAVHCD